MSISSSDWIKFCFFMVLELPNSMRIQLDYNLSLNLSAETRIGDSAQFLSVVVSQIILV